MWRGVVAMVLVAVAVAVVAVDPEEGVAAQDELTIAHVAVRQGDAAIYQGPCGQTAVVDTPRFRAGNVAAALDAYAGTRELRWASPTHYHSDHVGGLADLEREHGVAIAAVYDRGDGRDAYDTQTYRDYHDHFDGRRTPIDIGFALSLCDGDEEVTFEVVSVGVEGTAAGGTPVTNEDDKSLCVRVAFRDFTQATCGDLSGTDEGDRVDVESVVASEMGEVDVAQVNHHGSANSSNPTWVETLDPEHAVISVGANGHGHPADGVIDRWQAHGTQVWQTHQGGPADEGGNDLVDGDVTITTSGYDRYTVTGHHSGKTATEPLAARPDEEPPDPPQVGDGQVIRLAGADRFATGADAAGRLWPDGSATVVLATGFDYPDALAGGPVASFEGAPLLLATRNELPAAVREAIVDLDPDRVVLMGGQAALSPQLAQDVRDLPGDPEVDRLAGADRFATAAAAARAAGGLSGRQVAVASGFGFADALAAGALPDGDPANEPMPLVLASSEHVEADISAASQAVLVGGPATLPSAVAEDADRQTGDTPIVRLFGADRWATSLEVAQTAHFRYAPADTAEQAPLVVATGFDFADALSAAAIAGRVDGALLLTPTSGPTAAQADWIADFAHKFTGAYIVGGANAISPAAADQLEALLVGDNPNE